jgi:hypothetical protein
MGDWSTAPSLATALGTLVLALATFIVAVLGGPAGNLDPDPR